MKRRSGEGELCGRGGRLAAAVDEQEEEEVEEMAEEEGNVCDGVAVWIIKVVVVV